MTDYCGYIALVGRPNVGKSTLLNRILDQKISITSRKPQTTRHSIIGVRTDENYQFVYVDTPGIHQGSTKTINKMMNKTAFNVLNDVDVIVFILDGTRFQEEDEYILDLIKKSSIPCILVVNKIDKISDKMQMLPKIEQFSKLYNFSAIVPLSAKTGAQVENLHKELKQFLPESPHLFPDDQSSDRSVRFLCNELIREKIFRLCDQELPYSATVVIELFEETDDLVKIHALVLVDKDNHKRMIIGDKGSKLKDISTRARIDMEKLLGKKVFLRCYCKVKSGWSNNEQVLKQLGYGE
ncbi:MAG: GTPase Era [Legionellales bacterium RIFCSPHIGHO2_12_FULL_35_11]|nr:MAG: GTPase Era [Legionellales bacterium RIFCSPHIGHO2_12_FULL_35_11]